MNLTPRMVVSVQFQCGKLRGDWNVDLLHPDVSPDMPIGILLKEAIQNAKDDLTVFGDGRMLLRIKDMRETRARLIQEHFRICARKLIAQIEAEEGSLLP